MASVSLSNAVVKKIAVTYGCLALWFVLSFAIIIYNKFILDPKMYNWPFPISLTMTHMAFCSSLAFLLVRLLRLVEPPSKPPMTRRLYLTSVVPIAALYSLSLWSSNSVYLYLSVSFLQMLKALMPVAIYLISVLFKRQPYRHSYMANMLVIFLGVSVAAYGEINFNAWGVALQIAAVAFESTRLVLVEILLKSKGISLNPITTLYYVNPCCFLFLTVPWVFVELPVIMKDPSAFLRFDPLVFVGNSACAFGLNVAVFLLVGNTSALTTSVGGIVKDWLLISFSWSVMKDTVTVVNLMGYGVAFLGVFYYNHVKLQGIKAEEEQKKMAALQAEKADVEKGKPVLLLDEEEDDHHKFKC